MSLIPYPLSRAVLFQLDPERAHDLTIDFLARTQRTPLECLYREPFVSDPITLAGLPFPNRVGMAAGLDKNARVIDGLGAMGFGFVEVGTATFYEPSAPQRVLKEVRQWCESHRIETVRELIGAAHV